MLVRDAAKYLTKAGVRIRESELRAWLLEHKWIYRKGSGYRAYADHVQADHVHEVPAKNSGHHKDGTPFAYPPTVRLTRKGLTLAYRKLAEGRLPSLFTTTTDAE